MTVENIEISSFIIILKAFQQKGANTFGMDIKDNGNFITLFPIIPESSDESDDITSINDLKV